MAYFASLSGSSCTKYPQNSSGIATFSQATSLIYGCDYQNYSILTGVVARDETVTVNAWTIGSSMAWDEHPIWNFRWYQNQGCSIALQCKKGDCGRLLTNFHSRNQSCSCHVSCLIDSSCCLNFVEECPKMDAGTTNLHEITSSLQSHNASIWSLNKGHKLRDEAVLKSTDISRIIA